MWALGVDGEGRGNQHRVRSKRRSSLYVKNSFSSLSRRRMAKCIGRALHTANRETEGANKASTFKVVGSHRRVPMLNKEETPIYSPIAVMRPCGHLQCHRRHGRSTLGRHARCCARVMRVLCSCVSRNKTAWAMAVHVIEPDFSTQYFVV